VAWQRIRGLREPARVSGWIYRIAGRLAGKRARASRPLPLVGDPPVKSCDSAEDQRLIALLAAVARLSQPHRDVISRKHFAGYQGDEIARHLGIAPGTVRSRLSRAYAELRRMSTDQDRDLRRG
jgi:RNA polymerase sigma factor (sigma-70 family)